ncbi:hypothetical protein FNF27_01709 [Cafeteria roenbergensis]|uniref:Tyrosine-protein kinase ephrin type A/B receptor-like domain-containing protein n=1 Tax=Cafeteria roenbergensis TaxID=33653 RepID=A0A5A8EJR6_CAFRO|nr:hypothetical protein FNF27_01709 [Cafeteria roenbergensis]
MGVNNSISSILEHLSGSTELDSVKVLVLSDNPLVTGPLYFAWPVPLGLQVLAFSRTGAKPEMPQIATAVSKMPDIRVIAAEDTGVTGQVFPPGMGFSLEELYFSGNDALKGSVLTFAGWYPKLRVLALDRTNLGTGGFEGQISMSGSKLTEVRLDGVGLFGEIPESWCDRHPNLRVLSLKKNAVSRLPRCSSAQWPFLEVIELDDNPIEGNLSDWSLLHDTAQLKHVGLSNTNLKGSLWPLRRLAERVPTLRVLRAGGTRWDDNGDGGAATTLPKWPFSVSSLHVLDLGGTGWTGSLAADHLAGLPELVVLALSQNNLEGNLPVPPASIQWYDLSRNAIQGDCGGRGDPSSAWANSSGLANLPRLQHLDISFNALCAPFPISTLAAAKTTLRTLAMRASSQAVTQTSLGDLNGARCLEELDVGALPAASWAVPDLPSFPRLLSFRADNSGLFGRIGTTSSGGLPSWLTNVEVSSSPRLQVEVQDVIRSGAVRIETRGTVGTGVWTSDDLASSVVTSLTVDGSTFEILPSMVTAVESACPKNDAYMSVNRVPACSRVDLNKNVVNPLLWRIMELQTLELRGASVVVAGGSTAHAGDVFLRMVCMMSKLTRLVLRGTALNVDVLPACLGALEFINFLDLSGTGIRRLPGQWAAPMTLADAREGTLARPARLLAVSPAFPALRVLDLSNNDLSDRKARDVLGVLSTLGALSELVVSNASLTGHFDDVHRRLVIIDQCEGGGSGDVLAGQIILVGMGAIDDKPKLYGAPTASGGEEACLGVRVSWGWDLETAEQLAFGVLLGEGGDHGWSKLQGSATEAFASLHTLDVSGNPHLGGELWQTLPPSLRWLNISKTGVQGAVPDSYGQLAVLDVRETPMRGVVQVSSGTGDVLATSSEASCCVLPSFIQASSEYESASSGSDFQCRSLSPTAPAQATVWADYSYDGFARCRCVAGFYGRRNRCTACPSGSTSPAGATAVTQCMCKPGMELVDEATGQPAAALASGSLAPGYEALAWNSSRLVCRQCGQDWFGTDSGAVEAAALRAAEASAAADRAVVLSLSKLLEASQHGALGSSAMALALRTEAQCQACPPFSTSEPGSPASESCKCLAGYEPNTTQAGHCQPCPINTYKAAAGNSLCKACPVGTFAAPASASCSRCAAAGIQCHADGISLLPGFFAKADASPQHGCSNCSATKLWGVSVHPAADLRRCPRPASCEAPGGKFLACALGYAGTGCVECASGFQLGVYDQCTPCPSQSEQGIQAFFILAFMVLVSGGVVVLADQAPPGRNMKSTDSAVGLLRIAMDHASLTALVMQSSPAVVQSLSDNAWIALIDVVGGFQRMAQPIRCALPLEDPVLEHAIRGLLAVAGLAVTVLVVSGLSACRGHSARRSLTRGGAAALALFVAAYAGMLRWAVSLVACTGSPEGVWVVRGAPSLPCGAGDAASTGLWWMGTLVIVLVGVVSPIAIAMWLFVNSQHLTSDTAMQSVGFLFRGLRLSDPSRTPEPAALVTWGDVVQMQIGELPAVTRIWEAARVVYMPGVVLPRMALVALALSDADQGAALGVSALILAVFLATLLLLMPYQARELAAWEALSLFCLIAQCLAGMYAAADGSEPSSGFFASSRVASLVLVVAAVVRAIVALVAANWSYVGSCCSHRRFTGDKGRPSDSFDGVVARKPSPPLQQPVGSSSCRSGDAESNGSRTASPDEAVLASVGFRSRGNDPSPPVAQMRNPLAVIQID